jgi:hypothetical protein
MKKLKKNIKQLINKIVVLVKFQKYSKKVPKKSAKINFNEFSWAMLFTEADELRIQNM